MTAEKHTPGPWLIRGKSDSVHSPSPTHPFGPTIFQFSENGSPSDADLALILAGPELLEALKMARLLMVEIDGYEPTGSSIRVIDSAIAKATGEQA